MPLCCQWNTFRTFGRRLYIKGKKDRIVPGSKPCRFTDDMSGSPFITADTCQKLLVPDALFACNNFIFNFFSRLERPLLLVPVHVTEEYSLS